MAGLEAVLKITAKDDAGAALAKVKSEISALDRQISTFDKLGAAVGKVAKSTDPLVSSVAASSTALREQRTALMALRDGLESAAGSTDAAASGQARLGAAIERTNAMMVAQGLEAMRVAEKIQAAQRRAASGSGGAHAGGFRKAINDNLPFAGPAILHETAKAVEAGAVLEQEKFKLSQLSKDRAEAPFAEALSREIAEKYPNLTQAEALKTYIELRGNAANQNGTINREIARRNLLAVSRAQTAALALGTEITPEDAQNLLKAVEGSGRAGDPTAIGKMFDAYIRAKQVFGTAISSDKVRDYVQNAKAANFGIGDEQFFWQNLVRMTEGNASRLGNETAQTLQTLVGGHATKQTAKWLVGMGLATGFTPQGGGAATIHGLSGTDVLQVNQLDWANKYLLPALEKHGVLSEANIKTREDLLKKDNPNIDARSLRERAETGLISAAIAQSGMRTTVTDNLAHVIANELLIARDTAQMRNASGNAAAEDIGRNPVAAFAQLTGSLSNFAAVVSDPALKAAGPAMADLAHGIGLVVAAADQWAKDHPKEALAGSAGVIGAGVGVGGWLSWKLLTGVGNLLGFGGGGGAAAGGAAAAGGGWLAAIGGALASAVEVAAPVLLMRAIGETANPTTAAGAKYRVDTAWPSQREDLERAWRAEREWRQDPEAARGRALGALSGGGSTIRVDVGGEATIENMIKVEVDASPELKATIAAATQASRTVIPLTSAPTGRMDGDARPSRGGIGHM